MPSPEKSAPVSLDGVRKVYRIYARPGDRLLEALTGRTRHTEMAALDGITLDVLRGETLGIVGDNGAGKSTLLKIVAGVVEPTSGLVKRDGRITSILELGAAFHAEISGRENAAMNAALLGLSRREFQQKLPLIREFCELGEFFDRPVRTYSSGMTMRLAFSIAAHLDPEVLIIDEALSVGDGHFQKKCIDRIVSTQRGGATILFCSHTLYWTNALCDRVLWLDRGRPAGLGPPNQVLPAYEQHLQRLNAAPSAEPEAPTRPAPGHIREVAVLDAAGRPRAEFAPRESCDIVVAIESDREELAYHLLVCLDTADHVECFGFDTNADGRLPLTGARAYRVRLRIPALPFQKGAFMLRVYLGDEHALHPWELKAVPAFSIRTDDRRIGIVDTPHTWVVEPLVSEEAALAVS